MSNKVIFFAIERTLGCLPIHAYIRTGEAKINFLYDYPVEENP